MFRIPWSCKFTLTVKVPKFKFINPHCHKIISEAIHSMKASSNLTKPSNTKASATGMQIPSSSR